MPSAHFKGITLWRGELASLLMEHKIGGLALRGQGAHAYGLVHCLHKPAAVNRRLETMRLVLGGPHVENEGEGVFIPAGETLQPSLFKLL